MSPTQRSRSKASAVVVIYDECQQGLLEECELLFSTQRGQSVNVSPLPFWELEHFPLHMYWQLCVHGETQSIMGPPHRCPRPSAVGHAFVRGKGGNGCLPEKYDQFPMTGKGDAIADWT